MPKPEEQVFGNDVSKPCIFPAEHFEHTASIWELGQANLKLEVPWQRQTVDLVLEGILPQFNEQGRPSSVTVLENGNSELKAFSVAIHSDAVQLKDGRSDKISERDEQLIETMRKRGASDEELRIFAKDLKECRVRIGDDGWVAFLLNQVDHLMESKGDRPVNQDERRRIAMQIVHHAARPTEIDQGCHKTCNVATVEERLFTRFPHRAAEVIVTAVISGEWKAPDGKVIKLDSLSFRPGPEERRTYPDDGARSHASQIFQVVAVNDATQRRVPPQFYRQDTINSSKDTGERLYDERGQTVTHTVDGKQVRVTSPTLSDNEIGQIGFRLTHERGYLLAHSSRADGDCVTSIKSMEDLVNKAVNLKRYANLPATVVLDMNYPGLGGSGLPKDKGKWHVISITDYDSKTGKFKVSNQWGSEYDREIAANDLFQAMGGWPQ